MTDKKHSSMTNSDDELYVRIMQKLQAKYDRYDNELYVRIMQKLQAKYDKLFEKIVFAQRENKDDIAYSHACEIVVVRMMMKMDKHELFKKLNECNSR